MTARTPQFMQWTAQFPPQWQYPQLNEQVLNGWRAMFEGWLALANAALSGTEHLRMTQLATDVETMQENRRAASSLAGVHDLNGLMAIQTGLARAYLEGCAKYWSAMSELARGTQAEITRIATRNAAQLGGAWQSAVQQATPVTTKEKKAA